LPDTAKWHLLICCLPRSVDASPLHAMFRHWRKAVQRARRQCEKALQMHQRRTWACCLYALQKNVEHSKRNRRLHIAAAKCVQRWTVRRCQTVLRVWQGEVRAGKRRAAEAAALASTKQERMLCTTLQAWCVSLRQHRALGPVHQLDINGLMQRISEARAQLGDLPA
jgi:hypothetical protein